MSSIKQKIPKYPIFDSSRKPKSENTFMLSLFEFYKKVAQNTDNQTIQKIAKRLTMSRKNRQPLKVSALIKLAKEQSENLEDKLIVFVGKVLDDEGLIELPKLKIVCLKASKTAAEKIKMFGGELHTLEKLIKLSGNLENIILVTSDNKRRKANKYFGAAGDKKSAVYPRTLNKGKNGERRIKAPKKKFYE